MPFEAYAQSPAKPGFSASKAAASATPDTVKQIADFISTFIAYPVYVIMASWNYIIDHTAAATLLTASVAGYIALTSIGATRSIARLRETFATYTKDNWDADIIKAKYLFSSIKRECAKNPQLMASYFDPLPKCDVSSILDADEKEKKLREHQQQHDRHEEASVTLRNIMNDYENKALGIRVGILDEAYAYRYSRGGVLADWHHLSPLVTTYRSKHKNDQLFIEFEGLVNAWTQGRSFRTGKKLRLSQKRTVFR